MSWKSTIFSPDPGPEFSPLEYDWIIREKVFCKVSHENEYVGQIERACDAIKMLEYFIKNEELPPEEVEIASSILVKILPHAEKWIFLP